MVAIFDSQNFPTIIFKAKKKRNDALSLVRCKIGNSKSIESGSRENTDNFKTNATIT